MTRRALRALFYLLPLALITNGASADNELPVACNLRGGGFALQRSGDCLQAGGHPKDAPGRGSYLVIPNLNRPRASAPPIATRGDTNGAPEPGLTAAERQAVERELAQMPTVAGSVGWNGFPRSRSGGQAGDQRGATGMRSCLCGNGMRVWSQRDCTDACGVQTGSVVHNDCDNRGCYWKGEQMSPAAAAENWRRERLSGQ